MDFIIVKSKVMKLVTIRCDLSQLLRRFKKNWFVHCCIASPFWTNIPPRGYEKHLIPHLEVHIINHYILWKCLEAVQGVEHHLTTKKWQLGKIFAEYRSIGVLGGKV